MPEAGDRAGAGSQPAAWTGPYAESPSPLFAMAGIVKQYGATRALDGVDFDVRTGEIHALLGENGAGKSTLMHILAGLTRSDAGEIRRLGRPVSIGSPIAARSLGIAMVHQHFTLVPAFTVAENLALDAPPPQTASLSKRLSARFRYSASEAAERALQRAAALGWQLDANVRTADLSVGTQQRVEIVKALATEARLLIFDEPTAVLSGDEISELFTVLRRLRDEGCAIILIAHKLAEILAVADRVTVLRLGERVASCTVAATNADQLAAWMMGSTLESLPAETEEGAGTQLPQDAAQSPPIGASHHFVADAIHVAGDRGEHTIRGVSLSVRGGEIFGIGGVDGNGQTALAEALVGLRVVTSGERTWNGGPFHPGSFPATAYIPQDRRQAGLAVTMTVGDNLLFDAVRSPDFRRGPLLKARPLRQLASNLIRMFDIRTPGLDYAVSALSGGNQQKIVVARALHANPEWIVAMNPTRGLDIHATRFVHTQLRQARARGAAIVVFSTDLDELFALSDRAAILSGGVLTEVASGSHKTTQIGLLLGGMEQKP